MYKTCFKCGAEKPLSSFYKHKGMRDGYLNKCIECAKKDVKIHRDENLEKIQEYDRNRPNHKERTESNSIRMNRLKSSDPDKYNKQTVEANKKWASDNPLKRKAHSAVSIAIRDCKLQKLSVCENCGDSYKVQAHHESYEEAYWLDVVWLCDTCHKKRHKILKEAKRKQEETPVLILPF